MNRAICLLGILLLALLCGCATVGDRMDYMQGRLQPLVGQDEQYVREQLGTACDTSTEYDGSTLVDHWRFFVAQDISYLPISALEFRDDGTVNTDQTVTDRCDIFFKDGLVYRWTACNYDGSAMIYSDEAGAFHWHEIDMR